MKYFYKAGFVKKETDGVYVVESFNEISTELVFDYWKDTNSDHIWERRQQRNTREAPT